MPKISLGVKLTDTYNILIDNMHGMREVVRHLIAVHGLKRIAFIRGPENNKDATERFQAYLSVLQEYNIPYDPQLTVLSMFVTDDGKEAVRILLAPAA
jgi:DNA-binding LacI/PurR family transcriptional regulator